MTVRGQKVAILLRTIVMTVAMISVTAFASTQTFTGTVGDAMCGAKHVMSGDDASCTRGCISKGSKYALLVGEKVYVLDTTDQALLATLEKRSGERVTVTGTEKDKTITVTSVKAAR